MTVEILLTLIAAAVAALKKIPGHGPILAEWIQAIEDAVLQAQKAHAEAQQAVDPSLLKAEEPVTPSVPVVPPNPNPTVTSANDAVLPPGAPPPFVAKG